MDKAHPISSSSLPEYDPSHGQFLFIRIIGSGFLLVGGGFFFHGILALFDPSIIVQINGESTNNYTDKLVYTFFAGLFFIVGVVFAILPVKIMTYLFSDE